MHLYIRRTLLGISYTAFVIIAPIVILYAVGYRPQISSPIPRAVGVILADSNPPKASIIINGIDKGTLPRAVPNIEPGITSIQVTKDGYTSWQKSLEIKSAEATDVRSIVLLPSSFDETSVVANARAFSLSPSGLFIATANTDGKLHIQDIEGAPISASGQLSGSANRIEWSPDGTYIIVESGKRVYDLFHFDHNTLEKVSSKALVGASHISWSPSTVGSLYGQTPEGDVFLYSITTGAKEVIVKKVNTYEIANRMIYYQTFQNTLYGSPLRSIEPKVLSRDTGKPLEKISLGNNGNLILIAHDGQLQLLKNHGELKTLSPSVIHASWSPDGELILIQTAPTELYVYNVENERFFAIPQGELHLVTRLSQSITNPQWFSDSEHIFYQLNGSLMFSEVDTRDHAIATPIQSKPILGNVAIRGSAKSIFSIQQEGKTSNLIQTFLQTKEDR